MDNLIFYSQYSSGNGDIAYIKTIAGSANIRVWASSQWSGSPESEYAVSSGVTYTPNPNNGGVWIQNNRSILINTTGSPIGFCQGGNAYLAMLENETNKMLVVE